jgi:predicted ATP-grasp superfamily ATP-dependent carboligase
MITGRIPIDPSTPAVVLKFDPNVMHHGGLGAIRSLGRLGIPVYGVVEGAWTPAARSRYLTERLVWRPDPDQAERTTEGLRRLAERIGRPAVLIPTDDAGAIFLAEHGEGLRGGFLFPAQPAALPRQLAGKHTLAQLCAELGVPTPRVLVTDDGQKAHAFAAEAGFPVIAKLATPWTGAGTGLRPTTVLRSADDLTGLWAAAEQAGAGLMLQEFIPAQVGGDWFVHAYCDAAGAGRPLFTGVKIRSYPAHAGLTSFGLAQANEKLSAEMARLFARLGYHGIADLDLRLDPRDGSYKLLDFNPRLGAQFRLFRDWSGLDVVTAAYLDLTGQPYAVRGQVSGRRFVVENYDPLGALGYWRAGELGLVPWLRSLQGAEETAWFAWDDLLPFGLMCARMTARGAGRSFARARIRRPAGHRRQPEPVVRLAR